MKAWLLVSLLAACSSGDSSTQRPCGPNGECPTGQTCDREGRCQPSTSGGNADAALPAADAPPPAADAPLAEPADAASSSADATAAAPDATAPPPDAPAAPDAEGPITVTVRLRATDGTPAVEATVGLAGRDGELTGSAATGDDGAVTAVLPAGGMVTWVDGASLVTVAGLADGDVVDMGLSATAAVASEEVTASWAALQPGATQHGAEIGCVGHASARFAGSGAMSTPVTVGDDCLTATQTYTLVGWAIDGDSSHRIAYAVAADVPKAQLAVALPAWRTDFATVDAQVPGAPDCGAPPCATFSGNVITADGRSYQLTGSGDVTAGAQTFRYPPGLGTTLRVAVGYRYAAAGIDGFGSIAVRTTGLPPSLTLDLATLALPRVSGVARAGSNARPAVSFTAAGSLAAADALVVAVGWKEGQESRAWKIYAPPSSSSPLRAPALPAALAASAPSAAAVFGTPLAAAVDVPIAGFHAVIASPALRSGALDPGATTRISAAGDPFLLIR